MQRFCADQLMGVFTDIFNLFLPQSEVPTCFKKTSITPVPKENHAVCLNDYQLVALTSKIMKCFKRLVMAHINSSLLNCLDPLQFAYRCNRSTANAISLALDSFLEHLENKNTKMKELIIDLRKRSGGDAPVCINGAEVEMVESIKFLGRMITNNLSWSTHHRRRDSHKEFPYSNEVPYLAATSRGTLQPADPCTAYKLSNRSGYGFGRCYPKSL
eukprot:g44248.t1